MEQPNLSYIKSMSGGDTDFEAKLISIIKTEFPQEKKTYFDSVNQSNQNLTAEIVHKLKHKISILGLEKSYETAASYEESLLKGQIHLQDEFEAILAIITSYLQKI